MMQRLFLLFLIFINGLLMPAAYAESAKINSINFDNSDSIIFLGVSAETESDGFKITKKTLDNPDRVYFDIENAVLTFPASVYEFKNSRLKQVRTAQNSLSPDIVRIVITSADGYNASDEINILQIKNNLIIKLGTEKPLQQYLTQVYKETKEGAAEYYDKAVILIEGKNTDEAEEIFNSVQKAFSIEGQELVRPNIEQKQARLKSRFFLNEVLTDNGSVLLSGIGAVNLEKPFKLSDPSRIVFDLPNTIVRQELRDKEFKLSDEETVKIGQFELSKARIVIKTAEPDKYAPVYGGNLQTLLIKKDLNSKGIYPKPDAANFTSFNYRDIDLKTDEADILFSSPVVYSIKREADTFKAVFYNLKNFDYKKFNALAIENHTGFSASITESGANIISFPKGNYKIDCYEALNASQLRFVMRKETAPAAHEQADPGSFLDIPLPKLEKQEPNEKSRLNLKLKPLFNNHDKKIKKQKKENDALLKKLNARTIVIDAGHGGNDTGAIRAGILEKDITLQIALKVREYLREYGITNIVMTRENDKTLTLDERVRIANIRNSSIYVSIHINASVKSEINGIETHYCTENGYKAAKILHKELAENVDALDRGLFKSGFYVIKNTEAPAVLLELGFISNNEERNALVSEKRQSESARAIAEGIIRFLTEQPAGEIIETGRIEKTEKENKSDTGDKAVKSAGRFKTSEKIPRQTNNTVKSAYKTQSAAVKPKTAQIYQAKPRQIIPMPEKLSSEKVQTKRPQKYVKTQVKKVNNAKPAKKAQKVTQRHKKR